MCACAQCLKPCSPTAVILIQAKLNFSFCVVASSVLKSRVWSVSRCFALSSLQGKITSVRGTLSTEQAAIKRARSLAAVWAEAGSTKSCRGFASQIPVPGSLSRLGRPRRLVPRLRGKQTVPGSSTLPLCPAAS